jgi:hypothetical protein
MEDFEERALEKAIHKLSCWYCYVEDTFGIWQHGVDKLKTFLEFLNSIQKKIQFTMEMEEGKHLPLLDINVYRRPDGTLDHRVYKKTYEHESISTSDISPSSIKQTCGVGHTSV